MEERKQECQEVALEIEELEERIAPNALWGD
jgi:hypothetical protein